MPELSQAAKTTLTLAVLVLLLLAGASWGWSALTEPLPEKAEAPPCVDEEVAEGDRVFPSQVLVSVLNAGRREGLAGRTMSMLVDQGFAKGTTGNAPEGTDVRRAQIWTTTPDAAAVRLVASRFRTKVKIVQIDPPALGVVVVVGDKFTKLRKGKRSMVAREAEQVCSPPVG